MSDNKSFFDLVNASPQLADRMATTTAQVITAARDLYGVQLELDEVAGMFCVRAAVLGAHDLDDYKDELEALQKVKDRSVNRPAKAQTPAKEEAKVTTLGGTQEAQARLSAARSGTVQAGGEAPFDPAKASDVAKVQYLLTIRDSALKMTLARRWGLQ